MLRRNLDMNTVLSWYFYEMNNIYEAHPQEWLYDSKTGKPVRGPGDRSFKPPKDGMLIFDHTRASVREFWKSVCLNATATGVVDGIPPPHLLPCLPASQTKTRVRAQAASRIPPNLAHTAHLNISTAQPTPRLRPARCRRCQIWSPRLEVRQGSLMATAPGC